MWRIATLANYKLLIVNYLGYGMDCLFDIWSFNIGSVVCIHFFQANDEGGRGYRPYEEDCQACPQWGYGISETAV